MGTFFGFFKKVIFPIDPVGFLEMLLPQHLMIFSIDQPVNLL